MRLGQLQKRPLITEGWNDPQLTLMEQKIIHPWVARVEQYVMEANLSQDQINQLFTSVEQGATAAGGNRTAVGKGVDVAKLPVEAVKWIDTKINELGKAMQNAGPVQNADAKFEELKQKIGSKDSKVVNAIKAVSDWAKENPGKASVAVGILTAAAAVAGGPLGGAVAGFLARATKDLLQGEKLSTAVGKSIKTAAYGAIAGWALEGIGDWLEGIRYDAIPYDKAPGLTTLEVGFTKTFEMPGYSSVKELGSMVIPENQVGEFTKLLDVMRDATAGGTSNSPEGINAFNELWTFAKTFDKAEFIADMNLSNEISKAVAVANDQFLQNLEMANSAIAAAAQASLQTSDDKKAEFKVGGDEVSAETQPQMASRVYTGQKLSEGQVYLLFNRLTKTNDHMLENKLMFESVFDAIAYYNRQTINEAEPAVAEPEAAPAEKKPGMLGKIGGAIKQGAKTAAGAIKGAAKQVTTKVTAEKLNRQWKEAGSPTDSDEIYDILKKAGVNDDVIKGTYDSMKIKPPAATDAPDGDQDPGAADAATTADAPTDSTAGDAGSDTSATGAADATAGGDDPAATDDGPVDSDPTTPGVQEKDKQFIMVQDPKDKTKYNVVDSKTQKVVDGGAGLDAGSAEEMRDTKNAEVVSQKQAAADTQNTAQSGATDADTASTSGDDAQTGTTDAQDDKTAAQGTDSTATDQTDTATSSDATSQTDTTSSDQSATSDKSSTSDQSATSDKSSDQTSTNTTTTSTSSNQGGAGGGGAGGGGAGGGTNTESSTTTTTSNQASANNQASADNQASSSNQASANNQASSSNQASGSQQTTSQTSSTKVDVKTVAKNIKTAGPKVTMDVKAALEKEVKAA